MILFYMISNIFLLGKTVPVPVSSQHSSDVRTCGPRRRHSDQVMRLAKEVEKLEIVEKEERVEKCEDRSNQTPTCSGLSESRKKELRSRRNSRRRSSKQGWNDLLAQKRQSKFLSNFQDFCIFLIWPLLIELGAEIHAILSELRKFLKLTKQMYVSDYR